MKLFGWKSAGRDDARPALSRYTSYSTAGLGDWPSGYEAQVRDGYAQAADRRRDEQDPLDHPARRVARQLDTLIYRWR